MTAQLPTSLSQRVERFARQQGLELDMEGRWVLGLSDFAQWVAARHNQWVTEAVGTKRFAEPLDERWLQAELMRELADVDDMAALQQRLRSLRNRCQFWVVWRHLLALSTLEETVSVTSMMADNIIGAALDLVYRWEVSREGTPVASSSGEPQRLVVLALGKLGAEELNLSSDVDLIFAYPEAGMTGSGNTNQQFFVRVCQRLIEALDPVTVDGFVFRMDMRLRPHGDGGPLVMHFAAIEQYFETQGRSWERYAFIKARACAGDVEQGNVLLRILKPFVYRRYLDFGSVDALREMHARLVHQRHHPEDVKLGPGGIRDAEFTVQVQQLIRGGRQAELQQRAFLPALAALHEVGHFDSDSARDLGAAYRFLRDTEHSIQAEADRQSQRLPSSDLSRERLALGRGFECYEDFVRTLRQHRSVVEALFDRAVQVAPAIDGGLWVVRDNAADFDTAGFEDPAATVELLNGLATARDRASVADAGRKCLDNLMPQLLQVVSQQERPTLTLQRVVPILRAVLRRSAYLVLLQENPRVLEHFVRLAGLSRWLAEELARQPMFLNVLVDQHAWEPVPDRETLSAELAERIAIQSGEPASEEMLLDELRTFKEQHVFRVAAAELRDTLPLMHVSDYLTHLAEAVLQHALGFAWDQVAAQHPEFHQPRPFIVVGYGKLGGIELGPGSDLDLVFLHDLPTSASQFLHRLVRKLLHVLTVPTYLGPLYKVDMRLRPSGNSGTLVSSLSAFRKYQEKQAWVWEHQALVRARVVAGDAQLARAFASLRHEILCQPRSRDELRAEVRSMRRRMAQHHGQELDLKRGVGGIVDIEFIVQYLVLAWADEHPSLATHSDNVRILEVAGSVGALSEQDAARLTSAYLALRGEWHRSVLDSTDVVGSEERLASHRDEVRRIWVQLFGEPRALSNPGS